MTTAHLAPILAEAPADGWEAYVCGSNSFAEHASRLLVAADTAGGPDQGSNAG